MKKDGCELPSIEIISTWCIMDFTDVTKIHDCHKVTFVSMKREWGCRSEDLASLCPQHPHTL